MEDIVGGVSVMAMWQVLQLVAALEEVVLLPTERDRHI